MIQFLVLSFSYFSITYVFLINNIFQLLKLASLPGLLDLLELLIYLDLLFPPYFVFHSVFCMLSYTITFKQNCTSFPHKSKFVSYSISQLLSI